MGHEDGALIVWVDILGEGQSQIVRAVVSESGEVRTGEDELTVATEVLVENPGGRIEQMRLIPLGDRYTVVFHPQGGDIGFRLMDPSGQPVGQTGTLQAMRQGAEDVLIDADHVGEGTNPMGLAWLEPRTAEWGAVMFRSSRSDGRPTSCAQRLTGLARPNVSPTVVALGPNQYLVSWVASGQPQTLEAALLTCPSP